MTATGFVVSRETGSGLSQFCHRIVGCLHNQRGNDQQEQTTDEAAAMLQRKAGANQRADNLAPGHQQAQLPQQVTAVTEPQQGRKIACHVDDLGRR